METVLSLLSGDKIGSNTDYRDALPVNAYAVQRPILGADGYMLQHPGLTSFADGVGVDRGGYWNERLGIHYRVSGGELIGVNTDGTVDSFGEISGSLRASMTHSFNTQAIVADGRMWLHDGTTLSEVNDSDLGDPIDITWIDGYYFLTDGEYIYHTNITNESQIDPLKFATAEFSPDPTLAVDTTSDNQVIVFGRYSTEYFVNKALENFAFQRIQGKAIKAGVVGTHCETEMDGTFYILGGGREESPSVHYISSGTYQSIASREVDKVISEYTESELSTAILETRVNENNKFIVVHLPRHTLLFNRALASSIGVKYAWTIVNSDVVGDTKWRAVNGVFDPRVSKWIYGDNQTSNIGYLDDDVATQYGEMVETVLYTQFTDLESQSIDQIEVETIPGHQVYTDNVTCAISLSYNGVTYGKEWWNLYGQKDVYSTRFIARRLGYVRQNVIFKLRCASREKVSFLFLKVTHG